MLLNAKQSCLLVVDVQDKLLPFVNEPECLVDNCHWLMRLAVEFDVPLLVTEQYPNGLGETTATLSELCPQNNRLAKVHFSVGADENCLSRINCLSRQQVVLCGMETSVCILQTALDLVALKFDVYVVVDAVSGRHLLDGEIALRRLEQAGCHLVTKEMVFFEWCQQAGNARFKALSKAFIQTSNGVKNETE